MGQLSKFEFNTVCIVKKNATSAFTYGSINSLPWMSWWIHLRTQRNLSAEMDLQNLMIHDEGSRCAYPLIL